MIDVGAPIPLTLQLFDGREDLTVKAQVLKPTLESMIEVSLNHVSNGIYANNSVLMPNVPFVIANYIVLDGAGESQDYERASDVFYVNPPKDDINGIVGAFFDSYLPKKDDYFVGIVFEKYERDDFIEGRIRNGT